MVYGTALQDDYHPAPSNIRRVLMRVGQIRPRVLLFSGGGNDVAGTEFESFLNHRKGGMPAIRKTYVDFMVNTVFRKYYEDLISLVKAVSPKTKIVAHGYGHTIPTGNGVKFIFRTWAGPWLLPALAKKRITDLAHQNEIVFTLLDEFNDLLAELTAKNINFRYVDLRTVINPYTDWVNELHLKNSAYSLAADEIDKIIKTIELEP